MHQEHRRSSFILQMLTMQDQEIIEFNFEHVHLSWKALNLMKKQETICVSGFFVEAEYHAMAQGIYELL